jgi:hypothetical protein
MKVPSDRRLSLFVVALSAMGVGIRTPQAFSVTGIAEKTYHGFLKRTNETAQDHGCKVKAYGVCQGY